MDHDIAGSVAAKTPGDAPDEYPYSPRPPTVPLPGLPLEYPKFAVHLPIVVAAMAVVFAVCNVALLPLSDVFSEHDYGAVWVFLTGGTILAEGGLFASVVVFGPGSFARRMTLCCGAAIPLWLCWAGGLLLHETYRPNKGAELRFGLLVMPLVALAIQAPHWYFRLYLGWRFVHADSSERSPQPLSIRDYLIGTAIAAFSLACAKAAVKPSEINAEYWAGWSVFFGCAAAISLASVLPAMLLMFRSRHWFVGLTWLMAYGMTVVPLISGVMAICSVVFTGTIPRPDPWTTFGVTLVFMSFAGFLGLGLKILRDWGWRLVLRRAANPTSK